MVRRICVDHVTMIYVTKFEGTQMYYVRVLIYNYSCDSREDVHKVNVNRKEGYAQTAGGSAHLVSFTDAVISPATDSMSTLCQ